MTEIPTTGLVNFSSGNLTSLTRRTLRVVACSTWNWKETDRNFLHEWQVQLGDREVTSRLNKILNSSRLNKILNSSRLPTRFTSVSILLNIFLHFHVKVGSLVHVSIITILHYSSSSFDLPTLQKFHSIFSQCACKYSLSNSSLFYFLQ